MPNSKTKQQKPDQKSKQKTDKQVVKTVSKVQKSKPLVRNEHCRRHAAPILKMLADMKQKSAIISDYVSVNKPDSKAPLIDLKDDSTLNLFRAAARASLGGQHIRAKLFYNTISTGGGGAAIAGFYALQPSASGEYATYAALYDECRCTGVTARYIAVSINSTGSTNVVSAYAVAYDPDYGVTPAGVNDLMDSEHVNMHFMGAQLGTFTNSPAVCPTDKHLLHARIRPSTVLNIDMKANPNLPGSWIECNDSSGNPATFSNGYMRYYVTATGGTSALQILIYQELQMEFRIRQ